jgi:hypothetical protein
MTTIDSESTMDARARRAARRIGLLASKSRWRQHSIDNHGGFMIIDPHSNTPVQGYRWDLSAEEVIEFCRAYADS